MTNHTIALFDIDGTLISTSAGRGAVEATFKTHVGSCDYVAFSFAGMTDRAIIRIGLENAAADGVDVEHNVEALFVPYLKTLKAQLDDPSTRYDILPGAIELVRRLRSESVALGLGTGNLEEAARLKLIPADLWGAFNFGGYASDAELRPELIRIGLERGGKCAKTGARCVIIGDTPKDISAAHANNALVIAVTTGSYDAHELNDADLVVDSLTDDRVFDLLTEVKDV